MNLLSESWRIGIVACALLLSSCAYLDSHFSRSADPGPTAQRAAPTAPPDDPPSSGSTPAPAPLAGAPHSSAGPLVRQNGTGVMVGQSVARPPQIDANGDVTLNYVDTDIREIARVVLGELLHLDYTVDPRFQGMATFQTPRPLRRDQLLPAFQTVLEGVGGSMVYQNGVFRITTLGNTSIVPAVVQPTSLGDGSEIVPLRYASAKQLATMLTPYVGDGARITADPNRNVLILTGSPNARQNLLDLVRSFDVDYLAGQSYALFPVKSGEPEKVATDLEHALQIDADGPLSGAIKVVPLDQANAIMVIAQQPDYLDRAARLIRQLDRVTEDDGRNLHIYYLKNVQAVDIQPVLQTAFNPPREGAGGANAGGPGSLPPTATPAQLAAPPAGSAPSGAAATPGSTASASPASSSSSPGSTMLGGASSSLSGTGLGGEAPTAVAAAPGAPQIIADPKGNSLLIVASEDQYEKVEAAVRQLDVLPAQVMVEATIAEVTLNKTLQYGTQFFFDHEGYTANLSNAVSPSPLDLVPGSPVTNAQLFPGNMAPNFPGFAFARTSGSAQFALQALEAVTTVKVISAPKILTLDDQKASITVGSLVPIITQSATSVSQAGAPVVNSVAYQPTGIILTVTPRISSGGLVTLDIEQEVSSVITTTSSTIDSPTFNERLIKSRVVVQDGQTVGLAGLISDNKSIGNSGIPVLRDIPVLGALFSTQDNSDVRTELLVLLTPRIIHDQREARDITEELKRKLAPPARVIGE